MKIVSTRLIGKYSPIILAAQDLFSTRVWQPEKFPIYDMVDYVQPDIVLFDLKYVDDTFVKITNEYTNIKWVLFGNGVPDKLNIHLACASPELSSVIKKHIENGSHKTLYLHDSANIVSVWGGIAKECYKADVTHYSYSEDPRLLRMKIKVLSDIARLGKLITVGPVKLPIVQYMGLIKSQDISSLYKSAKIVVDFNGEQLLDIAANGSYAHSNISNKLFGNLNPVDILNDSAMRTEVVNKAQDLVLSQDTCYHRLYSILNELGFGESNIVWQKIEQIQIDAVGS